MNLTQAFKIAVKSIAAKKARSALTMLGVIIGLAAVIILVSYAEGQNRQMREYYESLGNNVVNINAYSPSGRDLTKTIRDYCMEDLDDYILGLTPTVDYYDQMCIRDSIMLVTVTERTREIGIRKAIGAERKSIIAQFLIEACMICGIGGLFGIAAGYIGTLIVGKLSFKMILWPSPGVAVGSFFISVALGVIFGLYPACLLYTSRLAARASRTMP